MKTIRKILRSLTPPLVLIALTMSLISGADTVDPPTSVAARTTSLSPNPNRELKIASERNLN